jgi:hypothetical protein
MEITGFRLMLIILFILAASVVLNMTVNSYSQSVSLNFDEKQCPNARLTIQLEDGAIQEQNFVCDPSTNSSIEGFSTYVGKNDLNDVSEDNGIQSTVIATDSNKPRIFLRQGYQTTPSERNMVNRDDAIRNPRHDDIMRYNGPGCFERGGSEKVRRVQLADRTDGANIKRIGPDEMRRYQFVDNPAVDKCRGTPQVATVNTGRRLTLTADGKIVDQHVNYYVPQTYLGASGQRVGMPTGYPAFDNIARDIGEPADVDQIGSIPVNNFEGEPVPIGSITMP